MPKIVDHDAHSQDLARRAAEYFSHHGYAGSSMRKIAAHLGLSKSALYHYFPTKEALFLACTHQVMGSLTALVPAPDATEAQKLAQLKDMLKPGFAREMALIFDYLRGKSAEEIAADEAMQLALSTYRRAVAGIVGEDAAETALAQLLGTLLLDFMSGR
ncbi:TetR/AcrR family transcriptional regulator [Phaeobacter gallaeciensis]|uniref:TetR/AcrR family transcriptional regulator n=1 Tax=Phaeobacter gallaeciensis TaxID=60890 RepID=UPI000BBB9818|nr:TetR/AcrR family transcriptional regulator [Phaeobacter gallaeciensis]ATF18240.1 transcriptional regulator, TetR family [Phaeobacter gallaeciensis]ATF22349.1 transcriptional regulator, TetR family [Phaeobacter gallaeciensis]